MRHKERQRQADESVVIAAAVISPVDYSNLSWTWPLETARCHQLHTLSVQLFWSSPLSASIGKTVYQRQKETHEHSGQRKLDLVNTHQYDVRVTKSYTEQITSFNMFDFYCLTRTRSCIPLFSSAFSAVKYITLLSDNPRTMVSTGLHSILDINIQHITWIS